MKANIADACQPVFAIPKKHVLRGAFSLTLPVVLLVLGSYLISRMRSSAMAVRVEQSESFEPRRSFDGTLRIAGYNIAHGRGGVYGASNWDGGTTADRMDRLEQIGSFLAENELDVVVLNEVDFASVWSGHLDQAEVVASAGGYPYVVRQRNVDVSIPFVRLVFGNAILSRYPVVEAVWEGFEPLSRWEKLAAGNHDSVLVRIRLPDDSEIAVWGAHLESRSPSVRHRAARRILERAARVEVPLFVVGDLNSRLKETDPETAVSWLIARGHFQPFPQADRLARFPTFPSQHPDRTIDWVLFPKDWDLVDGWVGDSSLSDHLPVVAVVSR